MLLKDLPDPKDVWNDRIVELAGQAKKLGKLRLLTAFNANVDCVVSADPVHLSDSFSALNGHQQQKAREESAGEKKHLVDETDFFAALAHCMRNGKALRAIGSPVLFNWFNGVFHKPRETRLGGQAALMAATLKGIGSRVLTYPYFLSLDQARLFDQGILVPHADKKLSFVKPVKAARKGDHTQTNWVFEFRRGDALELGGEVVVAPRANRLIVAHHTEMKPLFRKEMQPFIGKLAKSADLALFSGFHSIHEKYSDKTTYRNVVKEFVSQIRRMKNANRKLITHCEFVPVEDDRIEKAVLTQALKEVYSLGINEVELAELLDAVGFKKEAKAIQKNESATTLYYGALGLARKIGLPRIHVHNLGYQLVVLNKKFDAEKTRDGALFGSIAASVKCLTGSLTPSSFKTAGQLRISEAGFNQLGGFETNVWDAMEKRKDKPISSALRKKFMGDGIFTAKDHYCIIVPTPIVTAPKATVGLGDVVSACAIAWEAC